MIDRDLRQAMEACRPGSDDLQMLELKQLAQQLEVDAELRREFELMQLRNAQISKALPDVAVPKHLRNSILERLEVTRELSQTSGRVPVSRRWMLAIAGLASTAALAFIASRVAFFGPPEPWDATRLDSAETEWSVSDSWKPVNVAKMPGPISRSILLRPTRWQSIRTQLDSRTTVFEFREAPAPTRLFVMQVNPNRVTLPIRPPKRPMIASQGRMTAAWIENDLVYFVTIKGTLQDYREVVHSPPASLAAISRRPPAS